MRSEVWWYVARASGLIAWLLLTASVLWGVVLSTDAFATHRRPAWLLDLHRWLGGLTVSFVAAHLAALVADSYTHFDVADLAIPFASSWRPAAVALGVLAMWLLAAVEVTSLAMRHLPRPMWRAVHVTSYVAFWLASLHAAFAGTDATNRLYQLTAAVSIAAATWALVYRLTTRRAERRRAVRAGGPAATVTSHHPLKEAR